MPLDLAPPKGGAFSRQFSDVELDGHARDRALWPTPPGRRSAAVIPSRVVCPPSQLPDVGRPPHFHQAG
jgi:hypothetical protein